MAEKSPVFYVEGDDPEMHAAYAAAQSTFRYFWRELAWEQRRIIPGLELATIKVAFWDGDAPSDSADPEVEHMWLNDVDFDGKEVSGTLLNDPHHLTTVKSGDAATVPMSRIEDWMYVSGGRVYGAHTVNLIRSRMDAGELRSHDAAWGLDFGDPATIELVPPPFVPKKPGFLSKLLGAQAPEPVAVDPDAEHPMSENMGEKFEDAIKQHPSMISDANDRGWTMLHDLALAGSQRCVEILLASGADKEAKTPDGRTARDLAESMGWTRVVAML